MSSNRTKRIELIAICSEEEKSFLQKELENLGCDDIVPGYKAVYFSVPSYSLFYRLHLTVKTASKLLMIVKRFSAIKEEDITQNTSSIDWKSIFDPSKTFIVEGVPAERGKGILNANAISKSVRLGIQKYFENKSLPIPKVDLKNPDIKFVAWCSHKKLTLSIDTSKLSLHKRGYRLESHPSPIKETLASCILEALGYNGDTNFMDPFMGSGTFVIEAGFIAKNKYPLLSRKNCDFGFYHLKMFSSELFEKVKKDLKKLEYKSIDPNIHIYGSDINKNFVNKAKTNLKNSNLNSKQIEMFCSDFFELTKPTESGLMISNLPYDERISNKKYPVDETFYKKIGDHLKKNFSGWTVALLVDETTPYKMIGLKPSRKIPFINGGIKVKLLVFDLYNGSKKLKNNI